jgi:hypothetical protein
MSLKGVLTMPLAFRSMNHGTIAFGFFNIETDMLLLEDYFFFATEFCGHISEMTRTRAQGPCEYSWKIHHIPDREEVGDLMGAIHGVRYSGFIGELYGKFPFPDQPEDFKQNPEGHRTQALVTDMIKGYGNTINISVAVDEAGREIRIGSYGFLRGVFQEMVQYVWRGGMPRWRNESRPAYVREMREKIESNRQGLFEDIRFED